MRLHFRYILVPVLLLSWVSVPAQKQESTRCPDRYLDYANRLVETKDYRKALFYLQEQRAFFPDCPQTEEALYRIIEIYHTLVMNDRQMHHIRDVRAYVIEYAEAYDDSAKIEQIKAWWKDIQQVENEVGVTARDFWQLVGSMALIVWILTAIGS